MNLFSALQKSRAEEAFSREIKTSSKRSNRMKEALNFNAESEANELLRVDLNSSSPTEVNYNQQVILLSKRLTFKLGTYHILLFFNFLIILLILLLIHLRNKTNYKPKVPLLKVTLA